MAKGFQKNYIPWWAWTAGIIDGEGSISIQKNNYKNSFGKFRYKVFICVRNTDKKMLEKLVELWGGKVGKRKNCWSWSLPNKKLLDFSEKIMPFLITKKKQMELATELQRRIENRIGVIIVKRGKHPSLWLTDEEREYRKKLREKIHLLNRPGRFAWNN
jgi:hypothetical protein